MYKKQISYAIVHQGESIYKAFWKFVKRDTMLIVIDDDQKFAGVVGRDDFNKLTSSHLIDNMTVSDICNRSCKYLYADQDIYLYGRNMFLEHSFNCVPVITRARDVVDLFTRNRAFYRQHYKEGRLPRMNYASQIWCAVQEAKRLGIEAISVIEFGVAGGNGLVNCEFHAKEISRIYDVRIDVYGFDNAYGLPASDAGYKDMIHLWPQGLFKMNLALLEERLEFAKLVLGDVKETTVSFCEKYSPAPIGTMLIDVDYYSSTVPVLDMLKKDDKFFMPRVYMYFDDVNAYYEFSGQHLAIAEFNRDNEHLKISPEYVPLDGTRGWVDGYEGWTGWTDVEKRLKICHRFKHPRYNDALYGLDDKPVGEAWTTALQR